MSVVRSKASAVIQGVWLLKLPLNWPGASLHGAFVAS